MEPMLLTFFSAFAQTFAAFTAFLYIGYQARLSWLDSKLLLTKSALKIALKTYAIEPHLTMLQVLLDTTPVSFSTPQLPTMNDDMSTKLVLDLKLFDNEIVSLKKGFKKELSVGLVLTSIGLVGIPLSHLIEEFEILSWSIIGILITIALFYFITLGKFLYKSLFETI